METQIYEFEKNDERKENSVIKGLIPTTLDEVKQILGFTDFAKEYPYANDEDEKTIGQQHSFLKKNHGKLPQNSLLNLYFSKKGDALKYRAVLDIFFLCDKYFKKGSSKREKLLNALIFLAALNNVDFNLRENNSGAQYIRAAIRQFVIVQYGIEISAVKASHKSGPKTRDIIYHAMNKLVEQYDSNHELDFAFVNMEGVKPKRFSESFGGKAKFVFSRRLNQSKNNRNQFADHFWLGKIPELRDFENGFFSEKDCKPRLIVSTVDRGEFITQDALNGKENKIVPASYWLMRGVEQICLPLFIDYGRPYRDNPNFAKAINPLTGEKFTSKEAWNSYLNELYRDVYYATLLMDDAVKQGGDVYDHCKAGKGRSVMVLGVYFTLHPEHLPYKITQKIGNINYSDSQSIRGLTDAVWEHMVSCRGHIDKDEASLQAVVDCVTHIAQLRQTHQLTVQQIKQHFNRSRTNLALKSDDEETQIKSSSSEGEVSPQRAYSTQSISNRLGGTDKNENKQEEQQQQKKKSKHGQRERMVSKISSHSPENSDGEENTNSYSSS